MPSRGPIILSTWSFGRRANAAAWGKLVAGDVLGAVEAGARDAESDPTNHTVGFGGFPDASGRVSCDAAIMLSPAKHGAVACVCDVEHPISLARAVMERTPHRLLVGPDAEQFARTLGMAKFELLTKDAKKAWEHWKQTGEPVRLANLEDQITSRVNEANHDTISLIAMNADGQMCAGSTTSGLAFKMAGRVGDSPIVGAGIYCDPQIGAAVCTGRGELVQGTLASFLTVEFMRTSSTPEEAIRRAIDRIATTHGLGDDDQVGLIAMRADGAWSSGSLMHGFVCSVRTNDVDESGEPKFILQPGRHVDE